MRRLGPTTPGSSAGSAAADRYLEASLPPSTFHGRAAGAWIGIVRGVRLEHVVPQRLDVPAQVRESLGRTLAVSPGAFLPEGDETRAAKDPEVTRRRRLPDL